MINDKIIIKCNWIKTIRIPYYIIYYVIFQFLSVHTAHVMVFQQVNLVFAKYYANTLFLLLYYVILRYNM